MLDDEFHRASSHVIHRARSSNCHLAHARAQFGCHPRRRGFFEHFLVAALHRAIALEQIDVVPLRVAKHLNFNMAWALYVFFNQHRIHAKAVDGFALATGERRSEVFAFLDHAHAFAAAAGAGFDQHRVADAVCLALQQGRVLVGTVVAGHQRHASFFHQLLGLGLEAHGLDGGCGRADEDQPGASAGLGKRFVLAQEAIAGVNGLCSGGFGGFQNPLPAEVAVFGRAAADVYGFVADGHVLGVRVCVGVDRHGLDAHALGRGCDPAGDLPSVCNQDFLKHWGSP